MTGEQEKKVNDAFLTAMGACGGAIMACAVAPVTAPTACVLAGGAATKFIGEVIIEILE